MKAPSPLPKGTKRAPKCALSGGEISLPRKPLPRGRRGKAAADRPFSARTEAGPSGRKGRRESPFPAAKGRDARRNAQSNGAVFRCRGSPFPAAEGGRDARRKCNREGQIPVRQDRSEEDVACAYSSCSARFSPFSCTIFASFLHARKSRRLRLPSFRKVPIVKKQKTQLAMFDCLCYTIFENQSATILLLNKYFVESFLRFDRIKSQKRF